VVVGDNQGVGHVNVTFLLLLLAVELELDFVQEFKLGGCEHFRFNALYEVLLDVIEVLVLDFLSLFDYFPACFSVEEVECVNFV